MPTGYTWGVEDGSVTELKDYAMACARSCGAYIDYRDSSDVPETMEVSSYYTSKLESAQQEYDEFMAHKPTYQEALEMFENKVRSDEEDYERSLAKYELSMKRYREMEKKVRKWKPGKDYEALKGFMLKQLEYSADGEYKPSKPRKYTRKEKEEYIRNRMEGTDIIENLDDAKRSFREEAKRIETNNRWIKGLKESLK